MMRERRGLLAQMRGADSPSGSDRVFLGSGGRCDRRMTNAAVRMIREAMDDLPNYPLPRGYRIRTYRPGDCRVWSDIVAAADPQLQSEGLFDREFGQHVAALADRCFFLIHDETGPIGTVTAWQRPFPTRRNAQIFAVLRRLWRSGEWGLVHWTAIRPEFQGRGLSKPLLSVAMRRIQQSHRRCFLNTSADRLAAIKVYLDFGFAPDLEDARSRALWSTIAAALPHPRLKDRGL